MGISLPGGRQAEAAYKRTRQVAAACSKHETQGHRAGSSSLPGSRQAEETYRKTRQVTAACIRHETEATKHCAR